VHHTDVSEFEGIINFER